MQPTNQQPVVFREGEPHQLHHSYIWLGGITRAVVIFVALFWGFAPQLIQGILENPAEMAEFVGLLGNPVLITVLAAVVLLIVSFGIAVLVRVLHWKNYSYWVGPDEVTIKYGIFVKKQLHVPYQRIQSVDQQEGVLQRIAGVCTIKIDTAGGASNRAISVPYILKAEGIALRSELFRRKAVATGAIPAEAASTMPVQHNELDDVNEVLEGFHGVFDGVAPELEPASYETGLSNKQLLLAGFAYGGGSTSAALSIVAVLGGLGSLMGIVIERYESQIDSAFDSFVSGISGSSIIALVGIFILIFIGISVVLRVISALGEVVGLGGFKVRRRASRIEVEHGLLQKSSHGIDIDRVQCIYVRQGFIRKLMGYAEVAVGRADATKSGEKKEQQAAATGVVIHPFIKLSEVPAFLASVAPEIPWMDESQLVRLPKQARRRAFLRQILWFNVGFWLLIVELLVAFILIATLTDPVAIRIVAEIVKPVTAVLVILMLLGIPEAIQELRQAGIAYNDKQMMISNGSWSHNFCITPRNKIQFAQAKANPFQQRAKVRTVKATTAAGNSAGENKLRDLSYEDAAAWLEWVRPRG